MGSTPTENRVPITGHLPIDLPGTVRAICVMAAIGPMTRSAEDLALLFRLITGPDGRDTEVPPVTVDSTPTIELKTLRVAFAPTFPDLPVAAEIRAAIQELAVQLGAHCQIVEAAALPALDYGKANNLGLFFDPAWLARLAFQPEADDPPITLAQYLKALQRRDQYIIAWEQFFQRWDVLLCPASMITSFPHCAKGSPLQVDGQEVPYWLANAHCELFNYTGHPALVVPYKLDHDGACLLGYSLSASDGMNRVCWRLPRP